MIVGFFSSFEKNKDGEFIFFRKFFVFFSLTDVCNIEIFKLEDLKMRKSDGRIRKLKKKHHHPNDENRVYQ